MPRPRRTLLLRRGTAPAVVSGRSLATAAPAAAKPEASQAALPARPCASAGVGASTLRRGRPTANAGRPLARPPARASLPSKAAQSEGVPTSRQLHWPGCATRLNFASPCGKVGGARLSQRPADLRQQASPRHHSSEDEDFVEGGVELPPEPHRANSDFDLDAECRSLTGEASDAAEAAAEAATRPLPGLAPPGAWLEEFWPRTTGGGDDGPRALFLDYDGTLRELEARPELAVPTEEVLELLAAINEREELVPHLISGRDAQFLQAHFGHLHRFTLMAEHGFQTRRRGDDAWQPGEQVLAMEERAAWRVAARELMQGLVKAMPDSHIEEKASSLVWHYREVADQASAEEAADRAADQLERLSQHTAEHQRPRITHGHKIVEASCRKARKGPAMRHICEEKALFGRPFLSVLVAGDDESDESMFDVAPPDFLTVKVGPGPSHARFRAESPRQLRAFLWQLLAPSPAAP